jgi:hypothetical protein
MVTRTKVLFFVLFSFLLQFALPSAQASALSFSQCTFSYTDSKKLVIESDCQNKLPEGNYTRKSVQAGKISYFFESEVNDQGLIDKCSAYIVVVSSSNGQGGTIGGTIAEKNAVHCTAIDAGNIKISTTAANNDTRDDAANKVLRTKLTDLIQKKCQGLGSADAISTCNSNALASVDACGNTALDAANRADSVGGAGTNASEVFIATIAPCISGATGLSESAIKKALGPDIYKEVSDASNNANVSDECVLDENNKCESENEDKTTCAVDGIGWIICPAMNFIAGLNDKAYEFLSDYFLQIKPELLTDKATLSAWTSFRDIANVLFVIAFLVIIYSQITGAGVTNYGIKKMLPRIIVAAILVNISYFICQIAVDISNIVGSSIVAFFGDVPVAGGGDAPGVIGGGWEAAATAVLAVAATVALVLLVILAPSVLLVLAVIVMILIARQAFVILLIVVSPIAFVAYLLPNTEQWFKKWWKALSTLLLLFPIIGIVFGASSLASEILFKVAGEEGQMLAIVALGVQALPLFAVPLLLKGALSAAGSVGQRLSGYADKAQSRGTKDARETAKRLGENVEARMAGSDNRFARLTGGYRNRRAFGRKSMETDTARRQQQALTQHVLDNPGSYNARQVAEAKSASLKEYNEEIGREKSTMSDVDHAGLMNIVKDKNASEERRAAAAGMIGSRSFRKGHQELLDYLGDESHVDATGKMDSTIKTAQQQAAYDMKDQPLGMGDADKSALGEGRFTKPGGVNAAGIKRTVSQEGMLQRLEEGKISEQSFASMNPDDLSLIQGLKTGGHLTPAAQKTIDDVIDRLKDPAMATVYANSKENAREIHKILHS